MESKFSKVKVNNEIELCRVTDMKVKTMIERALLEARISYFIKWEKPGLFSGGRKQSCVFQVNEWQIELACDDSRTGIEATAGAKGEGIDTGRGSQTSEADRRKSPAGRKTLLHCGKVY